MKQTASATPKSLKGGELKEALIKEVEICLDKHIKEDKFAVATFLDPRFRGAGFSTSNSAKIVDKINSKLKAMTQDPEPGKFIPVGKYLMSCYFCKL